MTAGRVFGKVRSSLWFVPVVCVVAGGLLSFVTIAVDRANDHELVPATLVGGPDAALAVLTTVAASMVTLTGLVLTITMVVVQLAMGQFSPRIVQTFLQDKPSQFAIGLFVATFAHAMLAMREVNFEEQTVPGLAIVVAYLLIVVSIVVLVFYVHHIGRSLRVSALIELVGDATRKLLDRLYPASPTSPSDPAEVPAGRSGVVNGLDHHRLVAIAAEHDAVLELVPSVGQFVPAGAALVRSNRPLPDGVADEIRRRVLLGLERSLDLDMAYGIRMLVDMAERAIAESAFVDPTTAVQAIDRIHDCLRQLAPRPFPTGEHRDSEGTVRLRLPTPSWTEYVHLAFDELVRAGHGSPPVRRHLLQVLADLRDVAPPDRVGVLDEVLDDLRERSAGDPVPLEPVIDLDGDRRSGASPAEAAR
jgi:uncharacterized membrane protein